MPSYVTPKKGAEYIFYISLASQANANTFQSNPTLAAGDFKVSIDGGALANPATLPAVTPAASKLVKVVLSASEMNGDNIIFIGSDASGAEWRDIFINIQTTTQQIDDLASQASVNTVDDFLDTEIAALQTSINTVDDFLDTEIAAIKAKTDNLPAAPAATGDIPTTAQIADAVWDEPLTQPSGVFAWAGSFRNALNWLAALSRNKMLQTDTETTLRNDADNADLATSAISDDGTTFTRGEWS